MMISWWTGGAQHCAPYFFAQNFTIKSVYRIPAVAGFLYTVVARLDFL